MQFIAFRYGAVQFIGWCIGENHMPDVIMYYHMVWATKYRQAIITQQIEPVLFQTIRGKSEQLASPIHAINAAFDHIHIAVEIAPKIAVSEWVRQIKAVSARIINRDFPNLETSFYWQNSYSARTFGKKTLPFVIRYIENQKQHHNDGDLEAYLEYIDDDRT